ncbi:MAG TPA: bifunctional diaminohydroxyphosphoribosylaminopyrimidine deaminase/5-amino-6-(5-phosphoribosylamino)uracil reductase RibD [Solirubrobacterales bacterium]|nr:bifunctional diaminohydroxyphosphoribosylaminopyrimidine deaminase/5-amino-6-(5-phosphoribosylamino)uracil reductase RibD [Solirubrobacterales bacterium]
MGAVTLTDIDRSHLRRALELAEGGRGRVSPNPLVGAILARDGEVIGEGFHAELGGLHAETAALAACRDAGTDPTGATLYVTLEPCAHHGRQPPCADAIVAAGISRVVIASEDPTEKAAGRGPARLSDAGVDVAYSDGDEAIAARLLNQPFRKHARTGRPHVVLKSALTLDGRTASADGDSRWISSSASRELVHRWRAEVDAVAVGVGTVLADDPLLTARDLDPPPARQPLRVVFDSGARMPLGSKLVRSVGEAPLVVVVGAWAPSERTTALADAGAEPIPVEGSGPERVAAALAELGRRGVTSLLLEGGAGLAGSFRDAGEIDELRLFIAPLVLGGAGARALIAGEGAATIDEAERALAMEWERSGDDLLVRARLREW